MPGIDRGSQRAGEQVAAQPGLYLQQPQMASSNKPQWTGGTPHMVTAPSRDRTWQQQQQDLKHREYLKQQQRLKAMGVPNNKNVSADALIGNLLEKKDTFRPKQSVHSSTATLPTHGIPSAAPRTPAEQGAVHEDLPPWIWPGSARVPPVYSHIWTLVVDPASAGTLVDTNRIFPLLLTSGLPTQVLGFIWNLAAQGSPGLAENIQGGTGQLTQQQLYVVLALVALAQTGCTFNSLSILKMLPQPPIPMFNMGAKGTTDTQIHASTPGVPSPVVHPISAPVAQPVPTPMTQPVAQPIPTPMTQPVAQPVPTTIAHPVSTPMAQPVAQPVPQPVPTPMVQPVAQPVAMPFQMPAVASSPIAVIPNTPIPVMPSQLSLQQPSARQEDSFFSSDPKEDDFTEFQSADTSSSIPSATVVQPSSAAKQVVSELNHSVIARLGNQGRSIGSRLANHTLGAPKTSRSHHHKHHRSERRPSIDTPYFDDEVTFGGGRSRKLSNDNSYAAKAEEPYIRHHHSDNSFENDDFNDFQMAIGLNVNVDELFPKCKQVRKRTMLLKESAIRNESNEIEEKPQIDMLSLDSPVPEQTAYRSQSVEPVVTDPPKVPPPLQPPPKTLSQTILPPSTISSPQVIQPPPISQIPVPPPIQPPGGKELMAVQEDKYSALRFLEIESTTTNASDDFGDFVSAEDSFAEIAERKYSDPGSAPTRPLFTSADPVLAEDSFSTIAERGTDTGKPLFAELEPSLPKADETKPIEFPVDDWLSFESNSAPAESSRPALEDLSSIFSSLNVNSDPKTSQPQIEVPRTKRENGETEDEFGDFVGPDMWEGDDSSGKVPATLLSDNRSVCSFEMTNASLSRHGSLPSLDLKIFPNGDDPLDKFKEGCVPINEWQRCLECCVSLLQSAVHTFSSISSEDVVLEVVGTAEGHSYFINLKEVRNVCNRILYSYYRCGQELNQIDTLLKTAQQAWDSLDRYYKLADIDTIDNENRDAKETAPCCICCCPALTEALEYNGHSYHASCANLWLNCV